MQEHPLAAAGSVCVSLVASILKAQRCQQRRQQSKVSSVALLQHMEGQEPAKDYPSVDNAAAAVVSVCGACSCTLT